METNVNGLPDQENPGSQMENPIGENQSELQASEMNSDGNRPKHRHHEDHHVNRKYRIFSNHSSYGDSPHTNTSF